MVIQSREASTCQNSSCSILDQWKASNKVIGNSDNSKLQQFNFVVKECMAYLFSITLSQYVPNLCNASHVKKGNPRDPFVKG